ELTRRQPLSAEPGRQPGTKQDPRLPTHGVIPSEDRQVRERDLADAWAESNDGLGKEALTRQPTELTRRKPLSAEPGRQPGTKQDPRLPTHGVIPSEDRQVRERDLVDAWAESRDGNKSPLTAGKIPRRRLPAT